MSNALMELGRERSERKKSNSEGTQKRKNALNELAEERRAKAEHKNLGGGLEGVVGGTGYTLGRIGVGLMTPIEGITDVVVATGDLIAGNPDMAKQRFTNSYTGEWREGLDDWYNPGKGMQVVGDIGEGVGQATTYGLISMIPYAGVPLMYTSIASQGVSSAASKTGNLGLKELGYGTTVGAVEGFLESKLGAGVKGAKTLGSAILKKTGKNVAKSAAKTAGKGAAKTILTETAKGFAGEFAEEAISEWADPGLQRLWGIDKEARADFRSILYAGVIGGVSGGLMTVGPAAINYNSAVKAGRYLQENGLDADLIKRAKYTLSGFDIAKERAEAMKTEKPSGDVKETAEEKKARKSGNKEAKKISKQTAQLADKISKNIQAYEQLRADPAMANSNATAAVLGELRGNLFLLPIAYQVDTVEAVLREASDADRQAFVDVINEQMRADGKESNYTLADFDADKDQIRRRLAGELEWEELAERMSMQTSGEATETATEAAGEAQDLWAGIAEDADLEVLGATSEAERALMQAARIQGVPNASVAEMLNQFRKGTALTPAEFAEGWADGTQTYGRFGFDTKDADGTAFGRMETEAREAAVKYGRESAEAETKAREEAAKAKKKPAEQAGKKGKVVRGEGLNIQKLSDEQYSAYKASEVLAEVLGTDIVLETSIEQNGKTVNGYYSRKTNRLHININAMRNGKNIAVYTLGHEVTHYIKEWSPAKFKVLQDFVMNHLGDKAPDLIAAKAEFLRQMPDYKDYTVDQLNDLAVEEVVADSMELILTDGKVLNELANTDKSLWNKVKEWITNIISKIKKYYGELSGASKTAQVLRETMESLDEIERLFTEGAKEAGERARTAGVETEASTESNVIYSVSPNLESELDMVLSGTFNASKNEVYLGETSNFLTDVIGAKALAHYMPASKAYSAMVTREEYDANPHYAEQENYHGLGKKDFMEILEKSETPIIAFAAAPDEDGNKRQNRIVLVTDKKVVDVETGNLEYAVVVEEVDSMARKDGKKFKANKAITVFPRSKLNDDIQKAIIDHRLLDITKKGEHLFAGRRGSNPQAAIRKDALKKNIAYFWANVKWESEKNNKKSSQEAEAPSAIRLALEKAGYIDQNGQIQYMQESDESDEGKKFSIDETAKNADVSENRDLTDRELLGMALEGAVQNEDEWKIVKSYREQASMLELVKEKRDGYAKEANALERQIRSLRARMDEEGDPNGFIRKAMDEAIAKKREAEKMRDEQARILDDSTRELLRLKAAKPFRELIAREQKRVRAAERKAERAEEVAERKVERARENAEKKITREKERMEEQAEMSAERKEITIRKRQAQRILNSLNTMLYHPTKAKHVPPLMQSLVDYALKRADPKQFGINRDNIRTMSELAADIEKMKRKVAMTADEQEQLYKMEAKYEALEADTLSVKRQAEALMTAFETWVKETSDAEVVDENMLQGLRDTVKEIDEAPLHLMTLKSLEAVESLYAAIKHQVDHSNNLFATDKKLGVQEMGQEASAEVAKQKESKLFTPKPGEWTKIARVREFIWENLKPLTAFEVIGSDKLMSLFRNILNGEDVWVTDVLEGKKVLDEAKKKYGYNKWDLTARKEVTTADGSTVSLTLGERMSLYAYMFRDQAEEHLSTGGFKLAPDAKTIGKLKGVKAYEAFLNDQNAYQMRREDIAKMAEGLTQNQKDYARAVQKYLTSLGKKGNEVSLKLYGVEIFNETDYFPIKSDRDYLKAQAGKTGDPQIKNRGTFKETTPGANNPIVLEDFMQVTSEHINTMAVYHAFTLPMEDLLRVWNYKPVNYKTDENGNVLLNDNGLPIADNEKEVQYNSLKAEITKKYGKKANDYILQLMRDLNGGARQDSATTILDKGLTAFKRSATMLSLSTIIQQPTSIFRAMAYVDAKYFKGAKFYDYETVKKYAPVAAIKQIGGHDTGTGARTVEYLNSKEYDNKKEKLEAAITPKLRGGDPQARADYFGFLTEKADEVAWRYMFGACVNEQAAKLKKPASSEEVLKAAGERFADVVRRTQVYDSTLTRSEIMRSKSSAAKLVTAFGAEPATVVSMLVDGIVKAERGDKSFFRKTAGAVAISIIMNAMASSLIYAMRDDDEDENFLEKYVQALTGEIIEGFNLFEYLPYARDVMSLFKGYDVERSDMTLIGNLFDQIEMITSSKRSFADKLFGVSGAVSAFFGVPITNVYRDAKGIIKTAASFGDGELVTGGGTGGAVVSGLKSQYNLIFKLFGAQEGNAYELYKAALRGDTAHYERVAARYETEKDAEMALRKELRENDRRIAEAAQAKIDGELEVFESIIEQIEGEGHFDRNLIIRAVNNEVLAIQDASKQATATKDDTVTDEEDEEITEALYTYTDLADAIDREDTDDFKAVYDYLLSFKMEQGKTEAQAKASIKSSVTSKYKKLYLEAWAKNNTVEMRRILALLVKTGFYGNHNETAKTVEKWVRDANK